MLKRYLLNIKALMLLLIILAAVIAPILVPYGFNDIHLNDIWHRPSAQYFLGTDKLGRDILTRILYGGRISLFIALVVEVIAFPTGLVLGFLSVVRSGLIISLLNRIMDVLFSFPAIILALTIAGILGAGTGAIITAITIAEIPVFFRYAKTLVLKIYNEPFVEVLMTLGVGEKAIFKNHVLLHLLPPLIPKVIFNFATTIIFESTLSFLGIGIQPPLPSWGNMIRDGIPYISVHPALVTASCVILSVTILLLFALSDELAKKITV